MSWARILLDSSLDGVLWIDLWKHWTSCLSNLSQTLYTNRAYGKSDHVKYTTGKEKPIMLLWSRKMTLLPPLIWKFKACLPQSHIIVVLYSRDHGSERWQRNFISLRTVMILGTKKKIHVSLQISVLHLESDSLPCANFWGRILRFQWSRRAPTSVCEQIVSFHPMAFAMILGTFWP